MKPAPMATALRKAAKVFSGAYPDAPRWAIDNNSTPGEQGQDKAGGGSELPELIVPSLASRNIRCRLLAANHVKKTGHVWLPHVLLEMRYRSADRFFT